jgi:hypothetical protein
MLLAKGLEEETPGFVIAHDADGQDVNAQIGEIADGVSATSRNDRALTVPEYQNRGFPRDAGDFTIHEFICDQITENRDRGFREGVE